MDRVNLAASVLIIAPSGAAVLLALLARWRHPLAPVLWPAVTLLALVVIAGALVVTVVAGGVIGSPSSVPLTLGPLDPARLGPAVLWTLAPVGLGLLFCWIAWRARSLLLGILALAGLAVAGWVALGELVAEFDRASAHVVDEAAPGLLDPLAALLLAVSVVVGGLIVLYALDYEPDHLAHRGLPPARTAEFLAWLVGFLAAMHLLVLADDFRLLIVGWELTTLCSFVLIAFDGDEAAVTAGRRALAYNLAGGLGLGVAALALGPGATLSALLSEATGPGAALSAAVPLALGGCILAASVKSALAPFHPWLLSAMVAAAPVSALLHASTMVKAGSYLVLRLSPALADAGWIGPSLAILGGLTFAGAALLALRQRDLKRILALSTVSSLGLIAASAGLATPAAMSAGALLLAFHAVAKALAFLVVGGIEQTTGSRDVEALVGIVRTRPRLAGAFALAAAALALPPFGIAVAKWALYVVGAGDIALVTLLAVGGAASLALWTAVTARLMVRRPGVAVDHTALPPTEAVAVGVLATSALCGLILAGPIAALITDPAAEAAFGLPAALAAGWSVALAGAGFSVPMVAAIVIIGLAAAFLVTRQIRVVAPRPYLAGANLRSGAGAGFHGVRGQAVEPRSGGFYWGAALETGEQPRLANRVLEAGGWLAVGLLLAAVLLAWLGETPALAVAAAVRGAGVLLPGVPA